MINYLFVDTTAAVKGTAMRPNWVKRWREYGRDGVTIRKKA
jgi:hypothetical protein